MRTLADRYNGNSVVVKGRCSSTLTSVTDTGGTNILLDPTILNTPSTVDISSSSASDASAGVGARTIQIVGLGSNQQYQSEIITLNGNTVVTSVNTYYRLFFTRVLTVGTTGYNVGDIYIIKTGTGGTYSAGVPGTFTIASALIKVLATTNQGGSCSYTTPNLANYEWIISSISLSSSTSAGIAVLQVQDIANGTPYYRETYINFGSGVPVFADLTPLEIAVGPLTDVRVLVTTTSAGSAFGADLVIIRNNLIGG